MKIVRGDIWAYLQGGFKIVVSTNIGWESFGQDHAYRWNNMGAGLALQAAKAWPELPRWYAETLLAVLGGWPRDMKKQQSVPPIEHPRLPLIFLPVKPIHPELGPSRSWDQRADLTLIERGLKLLAQHHGMIALTFPGCGNGGLERRDVLPLMQTHLDHDRFVVVDRAWDAVDFSGARKAIATLQTMAQAMQNVGVGVAQEPPLRLLPGQRAGIAARRNLAGGPRR